MEQTASFKIVSYNIRFGGLGREELLTRVLQTLDADLIILQEATHPRVVEHLAEGLDMPTWDARKGFSLGFLSRRTVREWRWHKMSSLKHPVLEVDLERAFKVYGVHLRPHLFKWSERRRIGEVISFLDIVYADTPGKPHLVVGDFNSIAPDDEAQISLMPTWIRALIRISGGQILTEVIEKVIESGYTDGYRHLHTQHSGFTFPSLFPRLRLDYAFLSADLRERLTACRVITDHPDLRLASDHLPLVTILEI